MIADPGHSVKEGDPGILRLAAFRCNEQYLAKLTARSSGLVQIAFVVMSTESKSTERLIIPYGVARVTAENLQYAPRVEIDVAARAPLRMGDGPYRRGAVAEEAYGPSGDNDVGVGVARLDILRRLHLRDCDVFEKYLRRWIDLYFDFVAAQIGDASEELQAISRVPEMTLDPLLWGMAALRPLPRAHIPVADSAFVAVDIALWDGNEIIAIVFAGGEKARVAQGLAGRARLLAVDPPLDRMGEAAGPELIVEQLGDTVTGFWRGLAVPPDPFGPAPFRFGKGAAPSF